MASNGPTSPRGQGNELDVSVKVRLDQILTDNSVSFQSAANTNNSASKLIWSYNQKSSSKVD
jgi:hypothetical protein